ncbi:VOC family protein [Mucilaginibacter humi]|uniref:hypothetical protein n=1 Tax=Mucilaginibacter humi TaxID=2732510 RepID=UPI001FE56351|nr:hypothetical protein [Mucilaginibacter humi]
MPSRQPIIIKPLSVSGLAYAGPETGVRDRASYVLQQGKIRIVLTTPLHSDHSISDHIKNMAMA